MQVIRSPTRAQLRAFIADVQAELAFEQLFAAPRFRTGELVYVASRAATVTMTIASPAVVTWTAHGFVTGDLVAFSNSGGALPTGVVAGTVYLVSRVSANTFNLTATLGGALIVTTGVQSGTHTGFVAYRPDALLANGAAVSRTLNADLFATIGTTFGVGDGSTTFNLPTVATLAGIHAFIFY